MSGQGKRYLDDAKKVERKLPLPLHEAIAKVKSFKKTKFDQTVELCIHLGIDAKQADQMIRGSVALPHGVGQTRRVIAFCSDDHVEAAKKSGAIEAGGEELVKRIEGGWMEFDVAVAEPAMMRVISKLGRVLGPKGLMPSPKSGTVTQDIATAIKEYAAGKVEFRNDAGGNVHVPIGKLSFEGQHLMDNAEAFINLINKMRPAAAKGNYVKNIAVSATMTPGVPVQL